MNKISTVLVTGGAGYVGAILVPKLLKQGCRVKVLDLYTYGEDVFDEIKDKTNLTEIKGDICDQALLKESLKGCDAVIHLACISNDPSYELNPELGKSINYDAFVQMMPLAKTAGICRFIFASSSSVYGIKNEKEVTEDLPCESLTDYSKYKAMCEQELLKHKSDQFCVLILRPATVCGYSPRLRLDLTVNIFANHAINNRKIIVFGGSQKRPNIHIEDITDLYVRSLEFPDEKINGKIYNAGYENYPIVQIADIVRSAIRSDDISIETVPTNDLRSYHICSNRIREELGYAPKHTLHEAVRELNDAFDAGLISDPMNNRYYYNIKTMQAINLQ